MKYPEERYKIKLKPKSLIAEDSEPVKVLEQITTIRSKLNKSISRHNYLINLREEIATVPHEYMRSDMKEISSDENRHLLIRGCDAEIEELAVTISKTKEELHAIIFR